MSGYIARYSNTSTRDMVLSESEMQTNAVWIWQYMSRKGWTLNAVAGMLGNAQAESTLNPARPQNNAINNKWYPSVPGWAGDAPSPTDTWYGYGLFQMTPYAALSGRRYNPHNYGNWAMTNGYTFSWASGGTGGQMEPQLDWLASAEPSTPFYNDAEPSANQQKWYQHSRSPLNAPTTAAYGALTGSPEDCAITFYWNFERSGALDPGNRPQYARDWYTFLGGIPPTPPTPERRKMPFILLAYSAGIFGGQK